MFAGREDTGRDGAFAIYDKPSNFCFCPCWMSVQMKVYFASNCLNAEAAPWAPFPLGKKGTQQNASAGPGTSLATPLLSLPSVKISQERPAAFSRFSWDAASCDLKSSFASSRDRGLLLFLSSKSRTHTHRAL